MKIALTRHGESECNTKRLILGHLDLPLTDRGKQQAADLAKRLLTDNYYFDVIFSSDLSRAAETAKIVAKTLKILNEVFTPQLREQDLGIFSGCCSWNN